MDVMAEKGKRISEYLHANKMVIRIIFMKQVNMIPVFKKDLSGIILKSALLQPN